MRIGWQKGHPPEGDEDHYLVQFDSGVIWICKWDDLDYYGRHSGRWHWSMPKVVVWMPLPEPYKEDNNDDDEKEA